MKSYDDWLKDNPNCSSWECENTWKHCLIFVRDNLIIDSSADEFIEEELNVD